MQDLGDIIRRKREALRISQQAVAYALDMSQAAYSKIERGETEVKVKHVYLIAAYLELSVYELLPPSIASEVLGDYLLAPVVHAIRSWWYRSRAKKIAP